VPESSLVFSLSEWSSNEESSKGEMTLEVGRP
jgi:hypothetical protein